MAESYDDFRRKRAAISRDKSARGREIGPLPAVADPARKNACLDDLRLYCETYFAARFPLAWGDDHLTLIADLQRVVIDGGQLAVAMPRGSGKTTLAEVAALWAVCYGHRSYVMVIGATETAAEAILDNLKAEIETNDTLAEDFPEVCHPIRSLEGINNRANGQTLDGERTRIDWTAKSVTLPWVPGAASRGAVVQVAGLTGSIRGAARVIDGRKIRPDLVICDDPQTDESARSPSQVQTRESILCGAVLGLAGPAVKIAAVMPCTVIRPRDLADRVLDRQLHPEWSGRRCKLLRSMPTALELWDQFGDRLRHGLRQDPPDRSAAVEFYAANREAMDAGADPTWPARFQPGQLSAIQFAMELYLLDPKAFWAEYQNEPQDDTDQTGAEPIDPRFVADKLSRTNRGECPANVTRLTCGIDVQKELIFWVVCGWADDFTGSVVDYGTYPKQPVSRFSASDPSPSLSSQPELATLPVEARVYAGLEAVAATVLGREWSRADGCRGCGSNGRWPTAAGRPTPCSCGRGRPRRRRSCWRRRACRSRRRKRRSTNGNWSRASGGGRDGGYGRTGRAGGCCPWT